MVSTLGPLQRADRANTGRLQTYLVYVTASVLVLVLVYRAL